jgi:hypothetical protein
LQAKKSAKAVALLKIKFKGKWKEGEGLNSKFSLFKNDRF